MSQSVNEFGDDPRVPGTAGPILDGARADPALIEQPLPERAAVGDLAATPTVQEALQGHSSEYERAPSAVLKEFARRDSALLAKGRELSPRPVEPSPGIRVDKISLRTGDTDCLVVNLMADSPPYELWELVRRADGEPVSADLTPDGWSLLPLVLQQAGPPAAQHISEYWARDIGADLATPAAERTPAAMAGVNSAGERPFEYSAKLADGMAKVLRPRGGQEATLARKQPPLTEQTLELSLPRKTSSGWVTDTYAVAYFDAGDGVARWHGVDVGALPASSAGAPGDTAGAQPVSGARYRSWETTAELAREALGAVAGKDASIGQWSAQNIPPATGFSSQLGDQLAQGRTVMIIAGDNPAGQDRLGRNFAAGEMLVVQAMDNLAGPGEPARPGATLVSVQRVGERGTTEVDPDVLGRVSAQEFVSVAARQ